MQYISWETQKYGLHLLLAHGWTFVLRNTRQAAERVKVDWHSTLYNDITRVKQETNRERGLCMAQGAAAWFIEIIVVITALQICGNINCVALFLLGAQLHYFNFELLEFWNRGFGLQSLEGWVFAVLTRWQWAFSEIIIIIIIIIIIVIIIIIIIIIFIIESLTSQL